MKKLQIVSTALFFMLLTGFSASVFAAAGNASDANVPINTELVQPLGDFSQIGGGTGGGTGGAGGAGGDEEEDGSGTGATGGTKAAGDAGTAPPQTYYEKILKFLGL